MPQTAGQSHSHSPKRCSRCGAAAIHGNGVVLTQCSVALPPPSRQRECEVAQYCSYTCKEIHWPSHRKVCVNEHKFLKDHPHQRASLFWRDDAPLNVRPDFADECGVVPFATRPWENEHGNQLPPPVLAPCTELIGIPLMLRARSYPEISYLEERLLGPVVAASPALPSRLLMMDPDTGHVSTLWSSQETYCEAYCQDDKLLKPETLETILQFCYTVLQDGTSAPRTDDWSAPRAFFTPAAFELFSRTYFREQREKGRVGFDGPFVPL